MLKKLSVAIATLLPMLAVNAMAEEPSLAKDLPPPYNCDYEPSCEVAPGIYGAMSSPVRSKFNLSVGGYVKLDYVYNSSAVGPYFPQNSIPAKGTTANKRNESLMTARQSRLWFKAAGPTLLGAKTGAVIEGDFFGTGSLSNEFGNLRMRLAFASLDWANTQVIFGQFWDIFGLAAANTLDLRQGGPAGAPANPRVPQIRLTQKFNLNKDNHIKLVFGVQNPIQDAANPTGTPGSGTSNDPSLGNAGSYGPAVNGAAQITWVSKALGVAPGFWGLPMNSLQLGLFGLAGTQKITGNKAVDVYGYGFYGFVPLLKSSDGKSRKMTASFETQAYVSSGLGVLSANTVSLQGTAPNLYAPEGYGLLAQTVFYPTQNWGVTAGYGRRGIINSADYAAGTERYQQLLFVNTAYDLNAAVRIAAEFEHGSSHFKGIPSGPPTAPTGATGDSGQINTARLSLMYFF